MAERKRRKKKKRDASANQPPFWYRFYAGSWMIRGQRENALQLGDPHHTTIFWETIGFLRRQKRNTPNDGHSQKTAYHF